MSGSKKGLYRPDDYTYIGKYAINEQKFFSRLLENEEGCLVWQGGTHRQGYGMFNVYNTAINERQMTVTHRIAMMLHLGRELRSDEFIIHEFCDNQLCCNPKHMIVGDSYDRNRVAYAKGHRPNVFRGSGEIKKQKRAYKYTDDELRFMRNGSLEEIAEQFNVTLNAASHLKHRAKTGYKWLD